MAETFSLVVTSPTHVLSCLILQLCDFGFARAMSANTVVLRSIKGIYFPSSHTS
jgi:hypothetical protein